MIPVILLTGIIYTACDKKVIVPDAGQYTKMYMPQAARDTVVQTLVRKDSVQGIVYGAAYGGLDPLHNEITAEFEINPALVSAYNESKGTNYPALPEGIYELSATTTVIPIGSQSSEPLKLWVNPKDLDFETTYLLPITLTSTSGDVMINEDLQTTYFLIEATPETKPVFNRADWKVVEVSAEEVSGEGPDNGHAVHAIDGDINTFWHTQWAGAEPGLPHHITIDMNANQWVSGFTFTARQNSNAGRPDEFYIELSEDGEHWERVESFPETLPNSNDNTIVFLKEPAEARYFKFTVTSTYGATNYTHMAEINAF